MYEAAPRCRARAPRRWPPQQLASFRPRATNSCQAQGRNAHAMVISRGVPRPTALTADASRYRRAGRRLPFRGRHPFALLPKLQGRLAPLLQELVANLARRHRRTARRPRERRYLADSRQVCRPGGVAKRAHARPLLFVGEQRIHGGFDLGARARFAAPTPGVPPQCGGRGPLQMRSRHRGFAGGTGCCPRFRRRRRSQHPRPAPRSPRAGRSRARRTCGASCPTGDGPRHIAPSPLSAGCIGEVPPPAPLAGAASPRGRARARRLHLGRANN